METSELIAKVRKIEIKTRGLSSNIFAGQYHTAFKGRGMAFSEVREYQYGDEPRDIDWNVTARMNKPYSKVFEEERELTVMLLVDVSDSLNFGTQVMMKREMVTEIAATLSAAKSLGFKRVITVFQPYTYSRVALLKDGMIEVQDIPQLETFDAATLFARCEGIIPAPESSHAIAAAIREALKCKEEGTEKTILFNLSGHGLIDMVAYRQYMDGQLSNYEVPQAEIDKNLAKIAELQPK